MFQLGIETEVPIVRTINIETHSFHRNKWRVTSMIMIVRNMILRNKMSGGRNSLTVVLTFSLN